MVRRCAYLETAPGAIIHKRRVITAIEVAGVYIHNEQDFCAGGPRDGSILVDAAVPTQSLSLVDGEKRGPSSPATDAIPHAVTNCAG